MVKTLQKSSTPDPVGGLQCNSIYSIYADFDLFYVKVGFGRHTIQFALELLTLTYP